MRNFHKLSLTVKVILCAIFLTGCASLNRACSSCSATHFGASWVVVKNDLNGKPFRCWMLSDVSVTNESGSDGIYWKSPEGHLVHVSGNYDYVQVQSDRNKLYSERNVSSWEEALNELGLTEDTCKLLQNRIFNKKQLTVGE